MTTTLTRTPSGYRVGDTEVTTGPLSPREAQFTALAAAGLSRAEASQALGITRDSAHRLAQRLYYKLHCNSMLAAMAEARKRGYLRYYALILLVLASVANTQAPRARLRTRAPTTIARVVRNTRDAHAYA